jgi:hypothetical protein
MSVGHFTPILDYSVQTLVKELEAENSFSAEQRDLMLQKIITLLKQNCEKPEIRQRYLDYQKSSSSAEVDFKSIGYYPIDSAGFAQSFDPLEDEESFWNCWAKYGIIISKNAVSSALCKTTIQRIKQILTEISGGSASIDHPGSYSSIPVDGDGTPFMSRGFFEIYHDDSLAQLRQALRVYLHHVIIWGRVDLWTSFDRIGVKLPGHSESKALPLHVDQNPTVHPHFQTVQGVLALADCPIERGTFVAVPGSKHVFHRYEQIVRARNDEYRGEYVELKQDISFGMDLYQRAQKFALQEGDLITFDSRTTHANSANLSDQARIVAYIALGPAPAENPEIRAIRKEAFETGLGSNVRDALMHASMRPRYTDSVVVNQIRKPEEFNYLGKLLYGLF